MKILAAWIGTQDLRASAETEGAPDGPIAKVLKDKRFGRALLLANQESKSVDRYVDWLQRRTVANIDCRRVELADPTDHERIYELVCRHLDQTVADVDDVIDWVFHLSAGTPAMGTVWALLSRTKYPAELVQSSIEHGVKTVTLPFEISAEYSPSALSPADTNLTRHSLGLRPETYGELQFRSPAMMRLFRRAQKAMPRSFPIVIEGEPGTEKELLARIIHANGPRRHKPFIVFDCAAVPSDRLDEGLFGSDEQLSVRTTQRTPAWERAHGGTLLIDNIDRLPLTSQGLLQALLDRRDTANVDGRLGFDVRVIASSSEPLLTAVTEGRFLETCFFSLATLVLTIPPLRERQGDLSFLVDRLLEKINQQSASEPGYAPRRLSPGARNALLHRSWPGNVRELESTIRRAAIVADNAVITEADALDALLRSSKNVGKSEDLTNKPIEAGVDLQEIIAQIARNYLSRALEVAEGNKSEAARLLNMPSYQTFSNWLKKYEVD